VFRSLKEANLRLNPEKFCKKEPVPGTSSDSFTSHSIGTDLEGYHSKVALHRKLFKKDRQMSPGVTTVRLRESVQKGSAKRGG